MPKSTHRKGHAKKSQQRKSTAEALKNKQTKQLIASMQAQQKQQAIANRNAAISREVANITKANDAGEKSMTSELIASSQLFE